MNLADKISVTTKYIEKLKIVHLSIDHDGEEYFIQFNMGEHLEHYTNITSEENKYKKALLDAAEKVLPYIEQYLKSNSPNDLKNIGLKIRETDNS